MDIVICDDDPITRQQMRAYLERFDREHGMGLQMTFFDSGVFQLRLVYRDV